MPTDNTEAFLSNYVKPILSVGGGMLGSTADIGLGPFGTLGGAALGNAAGQSLVNYYNQATQGPNSSNSSSNLLGAAANGATQQMLGEGLGRVLSSALNGISKPLLETPPQVDPEIQYHGSTKEIPQPLPNQSKSPFLGSKPFYTTSNPDYADYYTRNVNGDESVVVNPYYSKTLPANQTITLNNVGDYLELGKRLGLEDSDLSDMADKANYFPDKYFQINNIQNAVRNAVTPPEPNLRGENFGQEVANAGIRRITRPVSFMPNATYAGTSQVENLNPDEDLIYKPQYDGLVANNQKALNKYQDAISPNLLSNKNNPTSSLINLFSQVLSRNKQ